MRALFVVVTLVLTAQTGLFAQVTYEELRAQLEEGAGEETLTQMIRAEGLAFDVDKKVLRQMKRDKFPDWLIDLAIDMDQGVVGQPIVSAYGGGGGGYYGNDYYDHHHPYYGHNYWWWDYWDYAWYGPASVFGFWGLGHPYNHHYYGYRYLNLRRPSGTVTRGGYASPDDDNYRGPARARVVRDDKGQVTQRAPGGNHGANGNSATRVTRGRNSGATATSRSSSSGGSRVSRSGGYQGSASPPAQSSGGGRSARRK